MTEFWKGVLVAIGVETLLILIPFLILLCLSHALSDQGMG